MDVAVGLPLKEFLSDIPTYASLNACLTLGYDTGLFDVLAGTDQQFSATELADKAEVKERYLTEWLRAMVTSKLISCKSEEDRKVYYLNEEQREALTDKNIKGTLYAWSGMTLLLGHRHEGFLKCFRKDGPRGMKWGDTPTVFSYMDKFSSLAPQTMVEKLITKAVPSLHERLESGGRFADIGCGTGTFARAVAQRYPKSAIFGFDISDVALAEAREQCAKESIENCEFIIGDTEHLPVDCASSLDGITVCDLFHGLAHVTEALEEWKRVLKDDGILVILDENVPQEPRTREEFAINLIGSVIGMYFCVSNGMAVVDEGEPIGPVHEPTVAKKMMEKEFDVDLVLGDQALYICKKK